MKTLLRAIAALLIAAPGFALADSYPDSSGGRTPASMFECLNGSNVSVPCGTASNPINVQAATMPLPTGAASASNQTAVQATAGSDASKALAVQGLTGGKPLSSKQVDSAGGDATDTVNHAVKVNVVAGNADGSVGAVGATAPASAAQVGTKDGSGNLQPVSAANPLPTQLDAVSDGVTYTGSISAAGTINFGTAGGNIPTAGYGYAIITFPSVGSGNVGIVEEANDGTPGTGNSFSTQPFFTANSIGSVWTNNMSPSLTSSYIVPVSGSTLRLRVSSYTSGTVTANITLKRGAMPTPTNVNVTGNTASGTADSGQPVKVGGVYNTTLPTFTAGNRGDFQLDNRGNLRVYASVAAASGVDGYSNSSVGYWGNTGNGSNSVPATVVGSIYNGSSWDRQRTAQGVDGTGLGITAVEEGGRAFSEITTATSTTVKGSAGSLHTVTLNTCVASATVKIYNALSATGTPITITCPSTVPAPFTVTYDAWMGTGIFVVTSGATDVTVTFR